MPTDIQARLLALTSPFAAELVRLARAEGHAAGLATGLERGRREAQTEIDGLTYAKGQEDERARCEAIVSRRLSAPPGALENARRELDDVLAAIRSGEPAPKPGT
jgi:DNA-binding FrmR family transcriptional regulator